MIIMMNRWTRARYQPCLPLGDNRSLITASEKHIVLSRKAASEGAVLLKNTNGFLPFKKGQKIAVFGNAQIDYVKGGGGSGEPDEGACAGGKGGSGIVIIRGEQDDELPVYFDRTRLQRLFFNGLEIEHLIYNGTQVFMRRVRRWKRCFRPTTA